MGYPLTFMLTLKSLTTYRAQTFTFQKPHASKPLTTRFNLSTSAALFISGPSREL